MTTQDIVNVTALIDAQRMRALHWLVVGLSFALMLVDGYDIVCIAYVAPLLQKEWGFAPSSFGLLFGAAPLGAALGPILFGPIADKVGRKPVVLLGSIWFGIFTLASVWADGLTAMIVLRLLAGFGIGGVVSTAIALVSEFAPRRMRATMIVFGVVGVALGGGLAGLIASQLLPAFTWRSVFWVGGIAPIVLGLVGFRLFPESPKFLALHPRRRDELAALLARLGAPPTLNSETRFILGGEPAARRFPAAAVFAGRLGAIVPLLMATTFLAQFALFFVNQWTTILLTSGGVPVQRAAYATAAFQIAGFVGALAVTRPVDWFGFLPVPLLFALAAAIIALMGIPGQSETTIILLAAAAGFCVIGLQFGNISTTGQVFPTYIRSLGVGICYGVGRFGSVVGPVIAGVLVGAGFSVTSLFYFSGALMLVGVVAGAILVPLYRAQLAAMRTDAEDATIVRFQPITGDA